MLSVVIICTDNAQRIFIFFDAQPHEIGDLLNFFAISIGFQLPECFCVLHNTNS